MLLDLMLGEAQHCPDIWREKGEEYRALPVLPPFHAGQVNHLPSVLTPPLCVAAQQHLMSWTLVHIEIMPRLCRLTLPTPSPTTCGRDGIDILPVKRAHHHCAALNAPQLDQVTTKSEHPVLTPLLAQLSVGGGKVSGAKVREFVQKFNIGLDRGLSPGTHTL